MAGFRAYDARPYAGVLFSAYQLLAIHYTGRQGVIAGDHRGLSGRSRPVFQEKFNRTCAFLQSLFKEGA